MSDTDRDMMAAEFVLGTLDPTQRAEARRLQDENPDFAAAVRAWENRLVPLSRTIPATDPPPDLWQRIEARTAAPPAISFEAAALRRRLRRWQAATGAAMAVAAVLAGVAFLRSQPSPQLLTLASTGKGPISLAMSGKPGAITLQPTIPAEAAPAGRDYELWSLPQGAKTPRPMGLLPPGGVHLAADIRPGTQIMVSLEPKGGSPTGLPTGPVIYAGVVERVRE